MIKRKYYLSPECEIEEAFLIGLICTSPTEGGVEGTEEEDWVI
jgi:hypothetical protein